MFTIVIGPYSNIGYIYGIYIRLFAAYWLLIFALHIYRLIYTLCENANKDLLLKGIMDYKN